MARRSLPVADSIPRTPTVDAMRTRLGGRVHSAPGVGRLVSVEHNGRHTTGVILFVDAEQCDVWIGDNRVRRVALGDARPLEGIAEPSMVAIALDAERFAAIEEGSFVSYTEHGAPERDGTLVEKCRFGALVLRPDGGIVGVGFRALRPRAAN